MSTRKLSNVSLAEYQAFLELAGCTFIRSNSGHDVYTRADLLRPIVPQNHISPVPERIIKQGLRTLGLTRKDFFDILEQKKRVVRLSPSGKKFELREA